MALMLFGRQAKAGATFFKKTNRRLVNPYHSQGRIL
jgi:hypothetical protein